MLIYITNRKWTDVLGKQCDLYSGALIIMCMHVQQGLRDWSWYLLCVCLICKKKIILPKYLGASQNRRLTASGVVKTYFALNIGASRLHLPLLDLNLSLKL